MTWPNKTFAFPNTLKTVSDNAVALLSGADAVVDATTERLDGVNHEYVKTPLSGLIVDVGADRQALIDALNVKAHTLCVHPYQHNVGQGESRAGNLSAPNAVKRLAEKLTDKADYLGPSGQVAAVCGLLPGGNIQQFVSALSAFNLVFPIPELLLVERRAKQEISLDTTKFQQFEAPKAPSWHQRDLRVQPVNKQAQINIGAQLGVVESYDTENLGPLAELADIATLKKAHNQSILDSLTTLKNNLAGDASQWLYLEGTPETIAASLEASNPVGHEYGVSAAVMFVAPPENLTILKEVFSL